MGRNTIESRNAIEGFGIVIILPADFANNADNYLCNKRNLRKTQIILQSYLVIQWLFLQLFY